MSKEACPDCERKIDSCVCDIIKSASNRATEQSHEFLKELKILLKKYNADLEAVACDESWRATNIVLTLYSEYSGAVLIRDFATINLGEAICAD